jgi:CDP-diacylglycerol--serine O-phosphatidyltransferase
MSVSVLPTLFTLGNLLCGFAAIFCASRARVIELTLEHAVGYDMPFNTTPLAAAAIFIFLGMVLDGLDGSVARLTRSTSELGGQLDSMADMITFGAAPAFLAAQLIGASRPFSADEGFDPLRDRLALIIGGIYVCCAALRLARFNVEIHLPTESDHGTFKGLPSPGAAGTVASLALVHQHYFGPYPERLSPRLDQLCDILLAAFMLLVALAMVSKVRYLHLINRYLRGRKSIFRVGRLVVIALLLAIRWRESMAVAFSAYAISAPLMWLYQYLTGKPTVGMAPAAASGGATPAAPAAETPPPPATDAERKTG